MEVLSQWLREEAGIDSQNLEQDFASGYLFARLLQAHSLQPDLHAFLNKGKPDALLNNYVRLQPTLSKLGVKLDTRTAQALINKEPGLAAKVLLSIKQQLESLSTNLKAPGHASKKQQLCTVRTSPSRGLLEAQQHKSQYATLDTSNTKFFEDVMRKNASSPNMLMESLRLKPFADEGSRQAAAAADATAAASAGQAAVRAAFREGLKGRMAAGRSDKATQLQHDEAVHAAILRHQDDVERQELRVEMALAELGAHRQQDQRHAAADDAAAGIDAFEMTLKRLGTTGSGGGSVGGIAEVPGPAAGESPMTTLGRIRGFAPTAAKLADSKGEYLAIIKARRQEEAAARKEREGRRRRMLVEQQAARSAAEGRVEADCLLEVLVRRSSEEQKLAQQLWQLQQEKAAMEAGRRLREEQYAALKDKEWEDTLRREGELHRSLQSQHAATVKQELGSWHQQQEAAAQADNAAKTNLARSTAWQLVQLAERVAEFRAATGGQAVPLADWRAWLSLFLAGDPSLGRPIISTDPDALHEPPTAQQVINAAELRDYLACRGAWALTDTQQPAAAPATPAVASSTTSSSRPATPGPQPAAQQGSAQQPVVIGNKALGEVVAELARLSQKLKQQTHSAGGAGAVAAGAQLSTKHPELAATATTSAGAGSASSASAPESAEVVVATATTSAGPEAPAVVSAAEAASGTGAAPGAELIHSIPLKLAVVGSPFSGKSAVAHTLAHAFGLMLLSPQQLVDEAVSAAAAWKLEQQQQDGGAAAAKDSSSSSSSAPELVALGLKAAALLQAGRPVSDDLLVQLLLLGMQRAKTYVPAPAEATPPEPPPKAGAKGSAAKGAAAGANKSEAGATGPRQGSSSGGAPPGSNGSGPAALLGVAAAMAAGLGGAASSSQGPALPPNLSAGTPGRGFVIDGFPSTEAQAVLLERALTGLDLAAEQQLLQGASLICPPPLSKLPQLSRPLLSGLDAVLLLECSDEALAVQRVLGRRLDPQTGQLYHLDFDPPPANIPGLCERLVQPQGQEEEAGKVPERLAGWASSSSALSAWLSRFSSLRRPLDGSTPLAEVLAAGGDVVSGILTAKGAAQAAQAAAQAAKQAHASAEQAQELSKASQAHAEAAARDLLAAKRAELQVLPLLTGGKNPDPAAAELLKAQVAAKCAEQLKASHAAACEAASQAEHARAAAAAAAAAVTSCKKSVGDASVSAEAQALANKAAADAEVAAAAAAEAAHKAQAAKQLSDGYAQDAEKWATAADIPADAVIAPPSQGGPSAAAAPAGAAAAEAVAASGRPVSGRTSTNTSAAAHAASKAAAAAPSPLQSSSGGAVNSGSSGINAANSTPELSLPPPGQLPAPLAQSLHEEWAVLESAYAEGMGRGFAGLREAHSLALSQVAANRSWFSALLQQPDNRQALLQEFVVRFNAVELDMRQADDTKAELLLRCEELRDGLWALCDAKHEAAESARLKLAGEGTAAEQVALMGTHLATLVQLELDRFMSTAQFLWSYCHSSHGVHHPSTPADKVFAHINVLQAAGESGAGSKAEQARSNTATGTTGVAAHAAALQQRLPQLAAALKAAFASASTAEASALSCVNDAQHKSAAAAAHAATTANTAAAAAAAAAGQSTAGGATGHRQTGAASAKSAAGGGTGTASSAGSGPVNSKASAAAAAASLKLAASSEEAAAVAAAAAAASAALPDASVLAAVHSEMHAALAVELALLQQRLSALAQRAAVLSDEVVQLHGTTHSQMAEWVHRVYVAECGAVAALERVVKAAAVAGKPLAHDLRLEGDCLVIDSSQQLVPPAVDAPPPRPSSPALPPGVLSVQQLCGAADAMQAAQHPAGFLSVQAAVELLLSSASQGVMPAAWCDVDAVHMSNALSAFDPTYSGYLDWRELLLALAAATLPGVHTATAAQLGAQAAQLAAADGDGDGCLTLQEFEGLRWWFEPRQELLDEATDAAAVASPQPSTAAEVLHQAARCRSFTQLLWSIFKEPKKAPAATIATAASTAPVVQPQQPATESSSSTNNKASTPAGAASGSSRRGTPASSRPGTASGATAAAEKPPALQLLPPTPASTAAAAAAAATTGPSAAAGGSEAVEQEELVVSAQALLLYLCPDRDLWAGISKAVAVVSSSHVATTATTTVDAEGVLRMCYPLIQREQAAPICRAPLKAQQVAAAVAAAATAAAASASGPTTGPASGPPVSGAVKGGTGGGAAGAAAAAGGRKLSSPGNTAAAATAAGVEAVADPATQPATIRIKTSQLMYSAACERIVALLLHRYQWKDVYVAALL